MRTAAVVMVVGTLVAGCTDPDADGTRNQSTGGDEVIVVGVSGAFAENQIVAEMYAQVLEHAGYTVERHLDLRSREVSQNALEAGAIDVKPEYLSSLLLFLDPNAESARQTRPMSPGGPPSCSGPAGSTLLAPIGGRGHQSVRCERGDGPAVRPDHDELPRPRRRPADVRRAAERPQRPFCLQGLHEVYGVLFNDFTPLDAGGPLTVDALRSDAVQIGLLFSTDPRIEQNGFVPLVDDRQLQDAENITPVIRSEVLDDEVRSLLDAVSAQLTSKAMTELVGRVVIDGQDVATVATGFLTSNNLL